MDSYQPFLPSFKSPTAAVEPQKLRPEPINQNSKSSGGEITTQQQSLSIVRTPDGFIGFLEVFIHEARDIHNICIYHKQDVYANLCLTSDPEVTVSSQIINGGGRNPIFNENLRLNVPTVDSSLKCEIWMLSRVKNYLEDQLLGFALVPLSDVIMCNGKLVREFPLSSTDLFHSPAGFVQLSLAYFGSVPEVMAIPAPTKSKILDTIVPDSENDSSIPCEYDRIEFPDLRIAKENQMMVSEYFGIPCTNVDSQSTEILITPESGDCPNDDAGIRIVESFSTENSLDSVPRKDSPRSSVSTNGSLATSQSFSDPSVATSSQSHKDKIPDGAEGEADSSVVRSDNAFVPPIISINIEPEQSVVQQEIVDMYMKSMQQFTESLAKMKLPMDIDNRSTNIENDNLGSEQKVQTAKGTGSRVFYGSRAFF